LNSEVAITILLKTYVDWVETLLKKSCDRTLTKGEVLQSLFHMIEVNDSALNNIESNKSSFGPELEELK
jgi:hypothetical protein